MGYNWFYEPVVTQSGSGSGSIIDKRGYVITNVHVIENASTITPFNIISSFTKSSA